MGLVRLILAIAVALGHLGKFYFLNGMIAVQLFFIISGFYMALIINEKYTQKNHIKKFYFNRLLRIFPLYLVVSLLTLIAIIWQADPLLMQQWSILAIKTKIYILFVNLFLIGQETYLYLGINQFGELNWVKYYNNAPIKVYHFILCPQAWSLSIELAFYAIAPILVSKKIKHIWLIIIIVYLLILRIYLYRIGLYFDPWTYRFLPTELALFITGIIGYKIYNMLKKNQLSQLDKSTFSNLFFNCHLRL